MEPFWNVIRGINVVIIFQYIDFQKWLLIFGEYNLLIVMTGQPRVFRVDRHEAFAGKVRVTGKDFVFPVDVVRHSGSQIVKIKIQVKQCKKCTDP
ncbi:hypothetical protein [Endozoicomonas sp. 4G]|uniref:hypothetical protein n=1 Tax=Endozoicomonas sp. 4G TaxID=2872754 RepID=UPI002078B150|nr:hypothetical protein [Endozoicomonas sp. 4G]